MLDEPPPKVIPTARGPRTIRARRVAWRCEWCSTEHTDWRWPGPVPRYCDECRQPAQNAMAAGQQRRKRATDTRRKRPVGRPRNPR